MSDPPPSPPNSISPTPGVGGQSARSSSRSKVPLPRYTSIDLENELPEMYNTSLNPNIHDPDMTMFFNRNAPPFHTNYAKRQSPPPSYSSRQKSGSCSSTKSSNSNSSKNIKPSVNTRRNALIASFLCIFFVAPIFFLLVFYMIPRLVVLDRPMHKY